MAVKRANKSSAPRRSSSKRSAPKKRASSTKRTSKPSSASKSTSSAASKKSSSSASRGHTDHSNLSRESASAVNGASNPLHGSLSKTYSGASANSAAGPNANGQANTNQQPGQNQNANGQANANQQSVQNQNANGQANANQLPGQNHNANGQANANQQPGQNQNANANGQANANQQPNQNQNVSAQPNANQQPPELGENSWQDLWGKDAEKQQAAQKAIAEAAAAGDERAMAYLNGTLNAFEGGRDYGMDYEQREAMQDWALDSMGDAQESGYERGEEVLGAREYETLSERLGTGFRVDSDRAQEIMNRAAREGSPQALERLRQTASRPQRFSAYERQRAAGEALAHGGKHLKSGDYKLIAPAATRLSGGGQAAKTLTQAIKSDKKGAMDALYGQLGARSDMDRQQAARLMGGVAEKLGQREISGLSKLAGGKDMFSRNAAGATLGKAAALDRPGAKQAFDALPQELRNRDQVRQARTSGELGALTEKLAGGDKEALGQLHDKLNSKDRAVRDEAYDYLNQQLGDGNYWALDAVRGVDGYDASRFRSQAIKQMEQDFSASQDPEQRARMAPYLFENSYDSEMMSQSLEAMQPAVKDEDRRSLDALSRRTTSQSFNREHSEMADQASQMMRDAAKNGHAGEVLDSIYRVQDENKDWKSSGWNDRPDHGHSRQLADMGFAAGQLKSDDPRIERTRESLRAGLGDSRSARHAVDGMKAMQDKLDRGDLQALGKAMGSTAYFKGYGNTQPGLGAEMTDLFKNGLGNLPEGERQQVASEALTGIREGMSRYGTNSALAKMDQLQEYLGKDDVQAVAELAKRRPGDRPDGSYRLGERRATDFLAGLVDSDRTSDAVKNQAAWGLTETNPAAISDASRANLVDYAEGLGDKKLNQAVIDKVLPQPPGGDKAIENLGVKFSQRVADTAMKAYQKGDEKDPMYQLGKLMRAQYLGTTDEFKGQIDQDQLNDRIQGLIKKNPELSSRLEDMRSDVLKDWQKREGRGLAHRQEQYMTSDAFDQRLRLSDPQQQAQAISSEVGKLAQIAPDKVKGVLDKVGANITQRETSNYPLRAMKGLSEEQRQELLERGFEKALGGAKNSSDMAKKLGGIINKLDPEAPVGKLLQGLLKRHGNFDELQSYWKNNKYLSKIPMPVGEKLSGITGALSKIEANGGLGTALSGMSATATLMNGWPQNTDQWASALGSGFGIAGNLGDIGKFGTKLPGKSGQLMSKLTGKTLSRVYTGFGGAADFVAAFTEGRSAFKAGQAGDTWAATLHGVSAGSAAISGGLLVGSALLAGGVTAPVGAAVLALTAVGMGASFAADAVRESDDLRMLRGVDAWTPPARLHYAMKNGGTDDQALIDGLTGLSPQEARKLKSDYKDLYGNALADDIRGDTSGNFESTLLHLLNGREPGVDTSSSSQARRLRGAMKGPGTNDGTLIDVMTGSSKKELQNISRAFKKLTGQSLESWIKADTSGWYETALLEQLKWANE